MIDSIIQGWWKILALLGGSLAVLWGVAFAFLYFIKKAKETGVDEIEAGPVKVDFDTNDKGGVV